MKNLKRALSFVMASAMLVGMMVVGSSAVAFGDADQIKNTEAVNTLVALGVLKGKDTGNFDPTGIVTRAEMAKMICVAYNGGKDPNLTEGGMYKDTKSHWARGYIDYCTNLGVVAGDTAGNFNPDKTVTGTEASKMVLVALGYNAVQEKFVNDANWANNINVRASQKGLYDDLSVLPSEGLTRDAAAQMIWNGMNAEMVKYTMVGIVDGNSVSRAEDIAGRTILSNKFKMEEVEGQLTAIAYTEDNKNGNYYTYTIPTPVNNNGVTSIVDIGYDFADDCSHLFGMNVKVLYKYDNNNNVKVFGMFAEGSNVMLETTLNNMAWKANTTDTIVVNKKDYKIPTTTTVVSLTNGYEVSGDKTMIDVLNSENIVGEGFAAPNAIKVIDNNGDKKADVVVVTSIKVEKVTFVNKTTVTTDGASYKFADCDIYNGVAVDDYVQITTGPKNNKPALTKLTAINGVIAGVTDNKDGLLDEIKVDGNWLYVMGSENDHSVVPEPGETYDLVVVNGFVYFSEQVSESKTLSDVIYLTAAEHSTGVSDAKAKVYFMDGSSATITLSKVDDVSPKTEEEANALESKLYTFTVKNNAYTLTSLSADNKVGFDGFGVMETGLTEAESKKYGNYTIADDAVVIAHQTAAVGEGADQKDATVKFYTGKQAKKFSAAFGDTGFVLYNTVKGIDTAKLVVLVDADVKAPSTAGTESYGYLTAPPSRTKVDGTSVVQYTMWTKSGSVTVLEEKSKPDDKLEKGMVVTYDDLGDGKIENVKSVGAKAAVTGMASDELVLQCTGEGKQPYTIDKDTVYLYISTEDVAGVEGGSVNLAAKVAKKGAENGNGGTYGADVYQQNIWFVLNEDDAEKIALVVVDVNNNVGGYTDASYTE